MRNLIRYMTILRLANEIMGEYGRFPDPEDIGAGRARLIYETAFEELVRQGMPFEPRGSMLVISTDGEEYAITRHTHDRPERAGKAGGYHFIAGNGAGHGSGFTEAPRDSLGGKADNGTAFRTKMSEKDSDLMHEPPREEGAAAGQALEPVAINMDHRTEDHEYYNDDSLGETYVQTIDEVTEEPGEDPVEVKARDRKTEEKEAGESAERDVPADGRDGHDGEETEVNGQAPKTKEEPENGDAFDHGAPAGPAAKEGAVPPEPEGGPDDGEGGILDSEAAAPAEPAREEKQDPAGGSTVDEEEPEDVEKEQKTRQFPSVSEMGAHLHRNDFTFNNGMLTVTAPDGSVERARLLSMPISMDSSRPDFVLLCAMEGGTSFTKKGRDEARIRIRGVQVIFNAWIDEAGYHTKCSLEKKHADRGASLKYEPKTGGDKGHIVIRDDNDELRIHIIPTTFKDTASGEAHKLLYYIDYKEEEASGCSTRAKKIRFEYEGAMSEVSCRWDRDVLYGWVGKAGG